MVDLDKRQLLYFHFIKHDFEKSLSHFFYSSPLTHVFSSEIVMFTSSDSNK
jgi:hypothetical protein